MRIDVVTIFPDYFEPMRHALLGRALETGALQVGVHNLRSFATGTHKAVDDRPAGGGPGMVMKPEVWGKALDAVAAGEIVAEDLVSASPHKAAPVQVEKSSSDDLPLLIVPTPAGEPFTQAMAEEFSSEQHVVFACGRYEGIDQRVFEDARKRYRVREVSIGDYVLIGGEVAVLVITEAMVRLIPGVLGNQTSHEEDSFSDGLLEAPSYTQPRSWRGLDIPEVLLSGDHGKVARFRREESLRRTQKVRPDLLEGVELDKADRFALYARKISSDINLLITPIEWERLAPKVAKKLKRRGYEVTDIHGEQVDLTCEPDNIFGSFEPVVRVVINGRSEMTLQEATQAVISVLPEGIEWYGSSEEGHTEPGIAAVCAWQHQ